MSEKKDPNRDQEPESGSEQGREGRASDDPANGDSPESANASEDPRVVEPESTTDHPSDEKTEGPTEPDRNDPVPAASQQRGNASGQDEHGDDGGSGRGSGIVVGLALVLALAGLGLSLVLYLDRDHVDDPDQFAALEAELAGLDERLAGLEEAMQDGQAETGEIAGRVDRLAGDLEDLPLGSLESAVGQLSDDLEAIETRVARRLEEFEERIEQVADEEVRLPQRDLERRVRLQEALALLRMGQDRLELAGDVAAARSAFARAGSRLEALDDPGLGSVRRAIASERESLESWQGTDWNEITGQIRALADSVDDWPVRETELTEVEIDEENDEGWMARARSTFSRLVEVRRREGEWLTPAETDSLRANLKTRLAALELDVARRDLSALESGLERVEQTLEEWFDPQAREIVSALESIDRIRSGAREDTVPETGEAASMLQSLIERDS